MPKDEIIVTITKDKAVIVEESDIGQEKYQSEVLHYAVTRPSTSLRYTVPALIVSAILAAGSVVLFYDSNKLVGKFKAVDVLKLLAGILINLGQNIYFTKDTIDVLRDLKNGDKPLILRISKLSTGLLIGTVATVPAVAAEYAESKKLLNTLFQVCALPMNIVGTFALVDGSISLGKTIFRKKQPLYVLTDDEQNLMQQAQKIMLINLQRIWPKIKQGQAIIPYQGSLPTKLFIAVNSLEYGEDLTFQNQVLYYLSKSVDIALAVTAPFAIMIGAAGYLASSMKFFLDGPIGWLHFGKIGSWAAAGVVMLPQYGLSIIAGLGVATMIGELVFSTSFAQGVFGKIKNLLPNIAVLNNNWMRGLLGLGLLSTLILGPFSGFTSQILYDKYFPDFPGKAHLAGFMNSTTVGFNMYYYFVVAILDGIAGYYRNYGSEQQRAIATSLDNFKEFLAEIRRLSADEIPHVLLKLHELENKKANISNNLPEVIADEESLLLGDKRIDVEKTIIEKVIGAELVGKLNMISFWQKPIKKEVKEHRPSLATAFNYQPLKVLTIDGRPPAKDDSTVDDLGNLTDVRPSKRCPGMPACNIL